MPELPPLRDEFMKLEYPAIMEKMAAMRADLARTETVYPLAMMAIYVWLFTHTNIAEVLWQIGMSLPFVIGTIGFVRARARLQVIWLLEEYTRRLEQSFYAGAEPGGWEHAFHGRRPMRVFGQVRGAAGAALLIASFVLAAFAWIAPPEEIGWLEPTETASQAPVRSSAERGEPRAN